MFTAIARPARQNQITNCMWATLGYGDHMVDCCWQLVGKLLFAVGAMSLPLHQIGDLLGCNIVDNGAHPNMAHLIAAPNSSAASWRLCPFAIVFSVVIAVLLLPFARLFGRICSVFIILSASIHAMLGTASALAVLSARRFVAFTTSRTATMQAALNWLIGAQWLIYTARLTYLRLWRSAGLAPLFNKRIQIRLSNKPTMAALGRRDLITANMRNHAATRNAQNVGDFIGRIGFFDAAALLKECFKVALLDREKRAGFGSVQVAALDQMLYAGLGVPKHFADLSRCIVFFHIDTFRHSSAVIR